MKSKSKLVAVTLIVVALLSTACFKSKIVTTRVPSNGPPVAPNGKALKVNGVTYALPRTVVKVDVPVKKTVETPGELEMFAPCFFSEGVSSNRIRELKKSFDIEPPTFATRGEPDPDQHFVVKTQGGYFEHKTMLLEYTPEGVLTKGEAESKDESLEFAAKTAATIISIAAKASSVGLAAFETTSSDVAKVEFQACRGVVAAEQARMVAKAAKAVAQVAPAAALQAGIAEANADLAIRKAAEARKAVTDFNSGTLPAATAEANAQQAAGVAITLTQNAATAARLSVTAAGPLPAATEAAAAATGTANRLDEVLKAVAPPPPPVAPAGQASAGFTTGFEKAVEVNDAIKRLQAQRDGLVTGATQASNIPPETLKLMLKETDDTIEAYQHSYFLGTSSETIWTGAFEFVPPTMGPAPAPVPAISGTFFWFSESDGLCEGPVADSLGIKIPPKFKPKSGCAAILPTWKIVAVRIERKTDEDGFLGNLNAAHSADETRDQQRGFYYRIPARAAAILQEGAAPGAKDLARSNLIVAQFGIVASLPASSAGRTTQYKIALDESTGALKNFNLGSDSLVQKSILDDVSSSASAILDAKKAREKAKADANDVLAQKKRELDLLKTQNEINVEKKKLETPGTP